MPLGQILFGVGVVLWSVVLGFSIIAFGQIMLAIREIALNTRKDETKHHSRYAILLLVAKINNILGWVVIVLGVVAGIYFAVSGIPIAITNIPTVTT